MNKCRRYGPDKLNLWPFYHLTFKFDLDIHPIQTNVSNGTTTPQVEHLGQIILKSMYKCRSYGRDKLIHVTFKCDLDLQPTLKNISKSTFPLHGQQLCQTILKFMHKCRSYDPDKSGGMHTRTHIHLSMLVTAMSRFTASGLDKKEQYSCLYSIAKPKVWLYSYSIHVVGCNNIH